MHTVCVAIMYRLERAMLTLLYGGNSSRKDTPPRKKCTREKGYSMTMCNTLKASTASINLGNEMHYLLSVAGLVCVATRRFISKNEGVGSSTRGRGLHLLVKRLVVWPTLTGEAVPDWLSQTMLVCDTLSTVYMSNTLFSVM